MRRSGMALARWIHVASVRRMRRSPFMEVRFASPAVAAGSLTCAGSPI